MRLEGAVAIRRSQCARATALGTRGPSHARPRADDVPEDAMDVRHGWSISPPLDWAWRLTGPPNKFYHFL
eukprot:3813528-Pyramimonas_sp.AAC.1